MKAPPDSGRAPTPGSGPGVGADTSGELASRTEVKATAPVRDVNGLDSLVVQRPAHPRAIAYDLGVIAKQLRAVKVNTRMSLDDVEDVRQNVARLARWIEELSTAGYGLPGAAS